MNTLRHHDVLSFLTASHRSIHRWRTPIAQALLAARKAAIRTLGAGAFAAVLVLVLLSAAQAQVGPLFWSRFENNTTINPINPNDCWPTGCWQDISGTDLSTSYTWPPSVWGGGGRFLLISDGAVTATTMRDYMFTQLVTLTGHKGTPTQALYTQITKSPDGQDPMGAHSTTHLFELHPAGETSDLYFSYWLRFQPGMIQNMKGLPDGPGVSNGGTWRTLFAYKTGSPAGPNGNPGPGNNGDYRVEAYVTTQKDVNGNPANPYWALLGDDCANDNPCTAGLYWSESNTSFPVPVDGWHKIEVFLHRSVGVDGRVWMAVDGTVIIDHRGPNKIAQNINRVMLWTCYTGARLPEYQWVDDLQIWPGFPTVTSLDPWYDPPYATHTP